MLTILLLTFGTNFYLTLSSDSPVSVDDLDIVNGHATSIDVLENSTDVKSYRIFATLTADPDFHQYPFDRHPLQIEIEPKLYNESGMILVIHRNSTGYDPDVNLPGWKLAGDSSRVTSWSYNAGETPYSRAVFSYDIRRDTTSNILKFFLPILLLLVISLGSLKIRGSSRLALNASMFIVAVFIHWRISDSIPLVAYATFLDMFMMICYVTIALVLISGILIVHYTETKDTPRADRVNYWSLRYIPILSFCLYLLLFLSLLVQPGAG